MPQRRPAFVDQPWPEPALVRQSQRRLGRQARREPDAGRRDPGAGGVRGRAVGAGHRDHRTRACRRPAAADPGGVRAARARAALRARRLRRRAVQPAPVGRAAARDREDRQVLRPRREQRGGEDPDPQGSGALCRDLRHDAGRRGHRDRGRASHRARPRHRARAGLLPRPAGAAAGEHRAGARRRGDRQRRDRGAARDDPRRGRRLHGRDGWSTALRRSGPTCPSTRSPRLSPTARTCAASPWSRTAARSACSTARPSSTAMRSPTPRNSTVASPASSSPTRRRCFWTSTPDWTR